MRSCIYCGRELQKDEQCTCPTSVAKRMSNSSDTNNANSQKSTYSYGADNTYHTGYTKRENPIKRAWHTYLQRKKAARSKGSTVKKPLRRNFIFDVISFIKSPVTTIYNPGEMSVFLVLLISAVSGIFTGLGLCAIFAKIINAVALIRGPLSINMLLGGISSILGAAIIVFVGALAGVVLFLVWSASLYVISKGIFKCNMRFWEFASKLVLCPLAVSISSILAITFGMFSVSVFCVIILCGIITSFVLTYEALRSIWNIKTPNQVLYGMLLSILIFGIIVSNIVWII